MSEKTIRITGGIYEGRILEADAFGKDGAFVRIDNSNDVVCISSGNFEHFEEEKELYLEKWPTEESDDSAEFIRQELSEVIKERNEFKALNDHHKKEVEKGNEYREKLKQTIELLHEQIRSYVDQVEELMEENEKVEERLNRALRVIDRLIE